MKLWQNYRPHLIAITVYVLVPLATGLLISRFGADFFFLNVTLGPIVALVAVCHFIYLLIEVISSLIDGKYENALHYFLLAFLLAVAYLGSCASFWFLTI